MIILFYCLLFFLLLFRFWLVAMTAYVQSHTCGEHVLDVFINHTMLPKLLL